MKIFIPFKIQDIGGTSTFTYQFRDSLESRGYTVTNTFCTDFDILFIVADCPLRYALFAKLCGKKIIQRLDGVYHPAVSGWRYPFYNLKMAAIHRFCAKHVIYQSIFSQQACERFLGSTKATTHIIYNGVNGELFTPNPHQSSSAKVELVTYAKFRRRDQIIPLIEAVKLLDPQKFSFHIYGSIQTDILTELQPLPDHIFLHGKISHQELPSKIQAADIFLFSDQSACPNSVLEALACGVAVIAYERGSIPELVKSGYTGQVIPLTHRYDPFYDTFPFREKDYLLFSQTLQNIDALQNWKRNARQVAEERFSAHHMFQQYEEILRSNQ